MAVAELMVAAEEEEKEEEERESVFVDPSDTRDLIPALKLAAAI